MKRRELIKSIATLPLVPFLLKGEDAPGAAAEIKPGHYLLFVGARNLHYESIRDTQLPPGIEIQIVPLYLGSEESIDDVVRLYKVDQ